MSVKRNRLYYLISVIIVIVLGLGLRRFAWVFPGWLNLYLGDILWGLMVFLLWGLLLGSKSSTHAAIVAVAFSISIEVSQLYHSVWIDAVRSTRLGGLVLGYGFLWSDILSYIIGILFGCIMERLILNRAEQGRGK